MAARRGGGGLQRPLGGGCTAARHAVWPAMAVAMARYGPQPAACGQQAETPERPRPVAPAARSADRPQRGGLGFGGLLGSLGSRPPRPSQARSPGPTSVLRGAARQAPPAAHRSLVEPAGGSASCPTSCSPGSTGASQHAHATLCTFLILPAVIPPEEGRGGATHGVAFVSSRKSQYRGGGHARRSRS
jgi:hypothetical protein